MQTFEGFIVQRSQKAIRFWGHYWNMPQWVPLSQIEIEPDGQCVVIRVRQWLCEANGFKEFKECHFEEDEHNGPA